MQDQLNRIESLLISIDRKLASQAARPAAQATAAVADASDLDSQWGDPEVKRDPPSWTKKGGPPVAPRAMSQGPADWLDAVASFYDWQAGKDDETRKTYTNKKGEEVETAPFKRRDAARARGWSARVRAGKVVQREPGCDDGPESLPF